LETHQPTCRRGEGFADRLQVGDGSIRGRAVPYGVTVELAHGVREQFRPGAFTRQLKDPGRVKMCLEHGQVIGRMTELDEQDDGLYFTATISNSPHRPEALRARAMIDEGDVDELSVGFNTVKGGTSMSREDDGVTMAVHHRARLMEVSLVPWGVYGRSATLQRAVLVDHAAELLELRRAEQRAWFEQWQSRKVTSV